MTKKANGEGSINRYGNGWRATITLGRKDDGSLVRKQFYGKTKIETLNKMNEYKNKYNTGQISNNEKITLQEWVKVWLFEYKTNAVGRSTIELYEGLYRNYIKNSLIGIIKLKDLKAFNIQAYYNKLIREEEKTPNTIKKINKVLNAALNQATKENYILKNPCISVVLPKIQSKGEIVVFTLEEQKAFIKALEGNRNKVLFLVALGTGLRLGELLALTIDSIDFENNLLTVSKSLRRVSKINYSTGEKVTEGRKTELIIKSPKTSNSERTIPVSKNLLNEINNHIIMIETEKKNAGDIYAKNNLLFPNEFGEATDPRNLRRSYERILKRSNIPYKKFHTLRHTFATRLFENDVPIKTVQKLMGHADTNITFNIYTHVMPEQKLKAIEKLDFLFSKDPDDDKK